MQAVNFLLDSMQSSAWLFLAAASYFVLTLVAVTHALLYKDSESSAIAWIGVILLSPLVGPLLYWLLGINRIKRRAQREFTAPVEESSSLVGQKTSVAASVVHKGEKLPPLWQQLMITGHNIHHAQYLHGNTIESLINGDEAYPAMLQAISEATHSIVLSSYIFDYDNIGKTFVEALANAHQRGVQVRVMIDGIGIGYSISWTKTDRALRKIGIKSRRFLPTFSTRGTQFFNLRNHRKILSIDGKVAFLGGINIRDNNLVKNTSSSNATRDMHFRCEGPVIDQLNAIFSDDWLFATSEKLNLPNWNSVSTGQTICRALPDGPDENYLKLEVTLSNAINAANSNIRIVTPYCLPDSILIHALKMAALRGIKVEIIVPKKSNIRIIDWAFRAVAPSLQADGVDIFFSPHPFDHTKLFVVDDSWCLIGSSNWDSRSMKLNFEINVECFDLELASALTQLFEEKKKRSELAGEKNLQTRSLGKQLRNRFFRLFAPYL